MKSELIKNLGNCFLTLIVSGFFSSCSSFKSKPVDTKSPQAELLTTGLDKAQPVVDAMTVQRANEFSIAELYKAANFFSAALTESLDKPRVLKTKYCGIKSSEISVYSMQTKSRIDDWIKVKAATDTPAVEKCASNCNCSLYTLIADTAENMNPAQKTKVIEDAKIAQSLQKNENVKQCAKGPNNFCQSKLFRSLKKSIR